MKFLIIFFGFFLCQYLIGQERDSICWSRVNDSLRIRGEFYVDSLKTEIKKDVHNYEAIKDYFIQMDPHYLDSEFDIQYFESLFVEIEKRKDLKPEYYHLKYEVQSARADDFEKIRLLNSFLQKLPDNPYFNELLADVYYRKLYQENSVYSHQYAMKSAKYFEKSVLEKNDERKYRETGAKLFNLYGIIQNKKRRKFWERQVVDKSYKNYQVSSIWDKKILEIDKDAASKISTFIHYVDYLEEVKSNFEIINKGRNFFNFLWLRSFYRNVAISLEENRGKYLLTWKISDKAESYSPYKSYSKEITKNQFEEFLRILTSENLNKSFVELFPGYDGSSWFLESNFNNKHNFRYEWTPIKRTKESPSFFAFVNACKYLIMLTGIKTKSYTQDVYSDFVYDPLEPNGFLLF